jgi:hypothetical protein
MRKVSYVGNVGSSTRQRVEPRQIKMCTLRSTAMVDDDMDSDVPNSLKKNCAHFVPKSYTPKSKLLGGCGYRYYSSVDHRGARSGRSTLSTVFDGAGASDS